MKTTYRLSFAAALCATWLAACSPLPTATVAAAATTPLTCDTAMLASLRLDRAEVTSATLVPAGTYQIAGSSQPLSNLAAFCQVRGQARPTDDSLINFEMWVPASGWNGKLVTTGNGGYSPALSYRDMAYALGQGYAALGGDTGHQPSDPNAMDWGVGHPEKIRDWGTRSIHAITVPGKAILAHLQGRMPSRAYYYGCSTGGHQGYAQVQQYPHDFDGVIAGAPGNNRVALNAEFLWRFQANRVPGTNTQILTPAKAALITQRALAACDTLDGVKDGVIADPSACTAKEFDVAALQCTGADSADCLTADQVTAARKIYEGPRNPRTGQQIYPGLVVGSEAGWPGYWGSAAPVRADFWSLWAFENPAWNPWSFDWDRDLARAQEKLAPLVDHVNPDIEAFKQHGGKLIAYQGWNDPVVNAKDTIRYYEQVRTRQGSQSEMDRFFRLFMVPGMGHCGGGTGPVVFGNQGVSAPQPTPANDLLMALDTWVERGTAPASLITSKVQDNRVSSTRPLCPHPTRAVYNGTGSTDDAASFRCR